MLIGYEGTTPALEDDAKGILSLIWNCYPGHPWYVTCRPGHVFIEHRGFTGSGTWGVGLRLTEVDHDAAVTKKKIIMLAGEWLERAGLARGRFDAEQEIDRVEGIPERYQPHQPMPEGVVIEQAVGIEAMREEARPQVHKDQR